MRRGRRDSGAIEVEPVGRLEDEEDRAPVAQPDRDDLGEAPRVDALGGRRGRRRHRPVVGVDLVIDVVLGQPVEKALAGTFEARGSSSWRDQPPVAPPPAGRAAGPGRSDVARAGPPVGPASRRYIPRIDRGPGGRIGRRSRNGRARPPDQRGRSSAAA